MPIVEQVRQVLAGTLDPRDIAPHLTTDRRAAGRKDACDDAQAQGGSAVRRAFKRALDQLRDGGRGARRDRPRRGTRSIPIGITRDGAFVLEADDPARFALDPEPCPRSSTTARACAGPRAPRRASSRSSDADGRARRSATSTSCSPSCTAGSARTAPCRACSSCVGLPYVGNGVLASALGMDKHFTKTVLAGRRHRRSRRGCTVTRAALGRAIRELWARRRARRSACRCS